MNPEARWYLTDKGDPDCRRLADRHYSRQSVGDRQFCRPGHNLVLFAEHDGRHAAWVWWTGFRLDGLTGKVIECTLFRNETRGALLSSDLVRDAVACVLNWEHAFPCTLITRVNATKTAGRRAYRHQPGHCYRVAGWVDYEHPSDRDSGCCWLQATAGPVGWPKWRRPKPRPSLTLPLFADEVLG